MQSLVRGKVAVWGMVLAACSSAPAEPAEVPVSPSPGAAALEESVGAPEPVPAPPDLFLWGRIEDPSSLTDWVSGSLNLPFSLGALVQQELPALKGVIRLDLPVDVAAALDPGSPATPKAHLAVSVPLSDYEEATQALRKAGARLERVSPHLQYLNFREQSCMLARANGPSKARLVCGHGREDLDALAPYLATTMPSERLGSGQIYFEVRAEPLRRRFGNQARWLKAGVPVFLREVNLGHARFDAALADASHAVVDEVLAVIPDLDKIVLRAEGGPTLEALRVDLGLLLAGQKSWTAQTLVARAADSAVAPEAFWRLPKDAEGASYTVGASRPERYQPMFDNVTELMTGALQHFGLSSPANDGLLRAVKDFAGSRAGVVGASGPVDRQTTLSAMGLSSYYLYGIDADAPLGLRFVDAFVKAFNDPGLRAALAKRDAVFSKLPAIQKRAVPASLGLPREAQLLELELPQRLAEELRAFSAKGKAAPQESKSSKLATAVRLRAIVVRDGERLWLAAGEDERLLAEKLRIVLAGNPEHTLRSHEGLSVFGQQRALSAVFSTVIGAFDSFARMAEREGKAPVSRDELVLVMPHRGASAIRISTTVEASGPKAWVSFEMPKAALEDIAAGGIALAAILGGGFGED